jgi:predicted HTH transcriptional regulator
MTKHWMPIVLKWLAQSLEPVPHELNEIDWKAGLTGNKERLVEHLIAFANHPKGGFLMFGVQDDATLTGVKQGEVAQIVNTLTNLGRDAVEPPLAIDYAVVDFRDVPLLIVHIPEQNNKPVHRRGKSIEEAWIRSGGSTRKASRQEVGGLMLNSQAPRWENLRASNLLQGADLIALFDLSAIANLLQRPLPVEESEQGAAQASRETTCPSFPLDSGCHGRWAH